MNFPVLLHSYNRRGESFDWYVSPTGNDTTGNGSLATPYKTVNKAHTVGSAGQSIGLLAGTHHEKNITISKAMLIKAVPDNAAIVSGATEYTSWAKTGGQTNVYESAAPSGTLYGAWNGATNLTIVADTATCDSTTNSAVLVDTTLYANIGGSAPTSIEATINNTYFWIYTATGARVENLTFQWAVQCHDLRAQTTIVGCTFRYWQPAATGNPVAFGFVQVDGANSQITNCTFTNNPWRYTANCVSTKSTASAMTVSNCTMTDQSASGGDTCVEIAGGAGHVVTNCTFQGWLDGVDCHGTAATTVTVSYITCIEMTHGAVRFNASTTGVAHHCVAYWDGEIASGTAYGYITDPNATGSFYHCILVNNNASKLRKQGFFWNTSGVIDVRNCIAVATGKGFEQGAGTPSSVTLDYNCSYNNTQDYSGCSAGANSTTSDPSFTDAAGHDFTLQAGSPCLNTGVAITGINDDYLGTAPDIGRHDAA